MIKKALTIGVILLGLLLFLSWCSPLIDPRQFWPAAFLGLLFPYLYIICGLIAVVGLFLKIHKAWLMVGILLISINLFRKTVFNISLASERGDLSILTHNIGSSIKGNKKPQWSFYRNLNPDVLCFQEWNSISTPVAIKDSLEKKYHHPTLAKTNFWPIFSKFPIIKQGELLSAAPGNGCTWVDVAYKYGDKQNTIRIYNVHLVSNKISDQTEQLMQARDLPDINTWNNIKRVLRKYKRSLTLRVEQAINIKRHINQSPYPVILAGDFNDIPASYVYRILHEDLEDGFIEQGSGSAHTYAGRLPFLHIDNVFSSSSIPVSRLNIQRVNYSDHYPVMAEIKLK